MKKIGFIGAYDKTDLILNIAEVLTVMNNKVLVIDSTIDQKAKYVVPAINPTTSYITNYEKIDISVGLYSLNDITNYLGLDSLENEYGYILIDIDNPDMISIFDLNTSESNYFVTAFDLYSLKKGVEILSGIRMPLTLTKILFSNNTEQADDEYLNYLALGMRVQWAANRIYFPLDNNDKEILIENQKVAKINIKNLSKEYKQALTYITEKITGQTNGDAKKAVKQMERIY